MIVSRCILAPFIYCEVACGSTVMVAKPFIMMVVATLLGPALGIGLFVLMQSQ